MIVPIGTHGAKLYGACSRLPVSCRSLHIPCPCQVPIHPWQNMPLTLMQMHSGTVLTPFH